MVNKIKNWWKENKTDMIPFLKLYGICCVISVAFQMLLHLAGCSDVKQPSTAKAIPDAVQSYEVPIADTSALPELLHLAPGQSAMLLKDVIVAARIPYNGRELYVGEVKIQKGTMLVKPKEDRQ